MSKTLKAMSALLSYPTTEIKAAAWALWEAIEQEGLLGRAERRRLKVLVEDMASTDIYELQERYVFLFDRTRSLSLHLFEHVHGESRDRGQAMIDLKSLYEEHGLFMEAAELPDYVPLFLEFLSTRPLGQARELLGQTAHILAALGEKLRKRKSPYEAIFRALVTLANTKPGKDEIAAVLATADVDPDDLDALDAEWEDEPVTFGPGSAGGCKDTLIARIRAARRPAPQA
jgi:nitrate reductase molybdenum cofactor assembly chaperone NarJ/NarW